MNELNSEVLTDSSGYLVVRKLNHPRVNSSGYMRIHNLIMERHLGRHLEFNEYVHHIDFNKQNNDISNLLLVTIGEHAKIHNFLRNFEIKNTLSNPKTTLLYRDAIESNLDIPIQKKNRIMDWLDTVTITPILAKHRPNTKVNAITNESKRINLPIEELKKMLPKMSCADIAKHYRVSEKHIYATIKRNNLDKDTVIYNKVRKDKSAIVRKEEGYVPTEDDLKKDLADGLSKALIAYKYNVPHSTVSRWVKRLEGNCVVKHNINLDQHKDEILEKLKTTSMNQLASAYDVSYSAMQRFVLKQKVEIYCPALNDVYNKNAALSYRTRVKERPNRKELVHAFGYLRVIDIANMYMCTDGTVNYWRRGYGITDKEIEESKKLFLNQYEDVPFKDELTKDILELKSMDNIRKKYPKIQNVLELENLSKKYNILIKDGTEVPPCLDSLLYELRRGKNLARIAEEFGVSLDTVKNCVNVYDIRNDERYKTLIRRKIHV